MMEQIPDNVKNVGIEIASCLTDATIQNACAGLGGCKAFEIINFPAKFHDLIIAYVADEIDSVTAIYIAMKRAEQNVL